MSTGQNGRERIAPDWTLGRLKESFPGVELSLFAFFGIGSRERSGFAASETLADLLRRHLVFDAEAACTRLDLLAAEDWQHQVTAVELQVACAKAEVTVIDARSPEDHARSRIAGSCLLSANSVAGLRANPSVAAVVVCSDGSQSPAASRHLRGLGLNASHLQGGLIAWAIGVDESFPINYPLQEHAGRWHLLADGRSLRFRRAQPLEGQEWRVWSHSALLAHSAAAELAEKLPGLELLAVTPRSFTARGEFADLQSTVRILAPWIEQSGLWGDGGEDGDPSEERRRLQRVLSQEAPKILRSHKGTVEIEDYSDRILALRLGGGCAGCASARVTTQRELAAALYREVPLLDRIDGAS
jgi:Fe-S cluster biogenesis protein NfuA/rhodanese-related sulfurtransferase